MTVVAGQLSAQALFNPTTNVDLEARDLLLLNVGGW